MEQRELELKEKEHQITQMMQTIEHRNNDLKVREAKNKEIESLMPSIRELQSEGIGFDTMMP